MMKIRDLPPSGSRVRLLLKEGIPVDADATNNQNLRHEEEKIGTIYSAYKMPQGNYGVRDRWRVPFLPEGDNESKMKSFSVRLIRRCKEYLAK